MKFYACNVAKAVVCVASSALLVLGAGGCIHTRPADLQARQAAAKRGDAKAQYELGRCYARGTGVPRDYAKAAEYLRKSATQGYVYAQTDVGSYYARGLGVNKDIQEALKWYRKAASRGDALAEYCLGYAYSYGDGV